MANTTPEQNKVSVFKAFDTLFNLRDYTFMANNRLHKRAAMARGMHVGEQASRSPTSFGARSFLYLVIMGTVLTSAVLTAQTASVSNQQDLAAVGRDTAEPPIREFGFDESGMNRAVRPGADFYGFVNGAWHARTFIPLTDRGTASLMY